MNAVSLGDLARTFLLRRQNVALKSESVRLSTEAVTGMAADTRKKVGGDLGVLSGIDSSLGLLSARRSVTAEAALRAAGMQSALSAINDAAGDLAVDLTSFGSNGSALTIDQLGAKADGAFRAAVSALNTRIGDRSIFAGDRPQEAALADAETMLAALDGAITGKTSAAQIEQAISDWFDSPAGYPAMITQAGPLAPIALSTTAKVTLQVAPQDAAVKATLKGLATAAMLNRGAAAGSAEDRAALARSAGAGLLQGQSARVELMARVGMAEGRIEAAATANAAEATALEIARHDLLGVDEYETATRLEATQTQIETLYSLTSRLSRMSLVDYI